VPVPESATESGVELALLVMLKVAARAPTAAGEKIIDSVQDEDAARVGAHVEDETEKSPALVPEMDAALMVTELGVVLLMVMDWALLLEPVLTLPKERLAGDAVTLPAGSPVPEREICCGLLESLSVKVSVAVRGPVAVGVKEMATVQLEEAASADPHVFL
jgi:hypothetical protein